MKQAFFIRSLNVTLLLFFQMEHPNNSTGDETNYTVETSGPAAHSVEATSSGSEDAQAIVNPETTPSPLDYMMQSRFVSEQIPLTMYLLDFNQPYTTHEWKRHIIIHLDGVVSNLRTITNRLNEDCTCREVQPGGGEFETRALIARTITDTLSFAHFNMHAAVGLVEPGSFFHMSKTLWGRIMFAIKHLYFNHLRNILTFPLLREINATTKHFFIFSRHFGLLDATNADLISLGPFPEKLLQTPAKLRM